MMIFCEAKREIAAWRRMWLVLLLSWRGWVIRQTNCCCYYQYHQFLDKKFDSIYLDSLGSVQIRLTTRGGYNPRDRATDILYCISQLHAASSFFSQENVVEMSYSSQQCQRILGVVEYSALFIRSRDARASRTRHSSTKLFCCSCNSDKPVAFPAGFTEDKSY